MVERVQNGILQNKLFFLGDLLALFLAQCFAVFLRPQALWSALDPHYALSLCCLYIIALSILFFGKQYKRLATRGYLLEFISVAKFMVQIFGTSICILFTLKMSEQYSRIYLTTWFLLSIALVYIFRLLNKFLRFKYGWGVFKKNIVVYSNGNIQPYEEDLALNYNILQIFNTNQTSLEELCYFALANPVDELFVINIDFSLQVQQALDTLVNMGIVIHFQINNLFYAENNLRLDNVSGQPFLTTGINTIQEKDIILKRLCDIVLSCIGLVLSMPIFLVVAPIVKFTDGGTVFFAQKRVGKNGRIFNMYKIRSMYMDAEKRKQELMQNNQMQGLMFKMKDDPRITPIGHFIRKTSIDELPQFWNVLKGEMSLVGTRPPTLDEYRQYETWHKGRLAIKPGITGLWQISGRSDITNFEQVVELDKRYIKTWSLTIDFKILAKTFLVVFTKRGSL